METINNQDMYIPVYISLFASVLIPLTKNYPLIKVDNISQYLLEIIRKQQFISRSL